MKLEALELVVPPKLRSGRFKATDKLIASLKTATLMQSKNPSKWLTGWTCRGELRVTVHSALQPVHDEFQPRTMWSLSNAFTSAFKELEPIPQYKATAKLAGFLQAVRPQ